MNKIGVICVKGNNKNIAKKALNIVLDILIVMLGIILIITIYNNIQIKNLAEEYGYDFIDLYHPLLNPKTGEIYEEYTIDGGHLTPAGYEVFTNAVTPILKKLLGK